MITKINHGNIFNSKMQTLVNPVNTVGVMGAGLAKQFAQRYPSMETLYKTRCANGELTVGNPWFYPVNPKRKILNLATKEHWRNPSTIEMVSIGLDNIAKLIERGAITSLALPMLGCGLGGLSKEVVLSLMDSKLGSFNIDIEIYT